MKAKPMRGIWPFTSRGRTGGWKTTTKSSVPGAAARKRPEARTSVQAMAGVADRVDAARRAVLENGA